MLASVPLIPKFASEVTAMVCELRNRDTRAAEKAGRESYDRLARETKMNRFAPSGAALLVLLAGLAGPNRAAAQDSATQNQAAPQPGQDDSRYGFHRMGDGFVRLDSRTGQLAQCGWAATGWSCKMVPDERAALESEIGRL